MYCDIMHLARGCATTSCIITTFALLRRENGSRPPHNPSRLDVRIPEWYASHGFPRPVAVGPLYDHHKQLVLRNGRLQILQRNLVGRLVVAENQSLFETKLGVLEPALREKVGIATKPFPPLLFLLHLLGLSLEMPWRHRP
ncbi:hypothetical protein FALCPG4_014860 [Fusarium falciforme]